MTAEFPLRFLLLLPPSPQDTTLNGFKTAYDETVTEVLKEAILQSEESNQAAVLEIAFACPHLLTSKPRQGLFHETQHLTALLYKLIVVIAAREGVNIEDDEGVDVRVILLAWQQGQSNDFPCIAPVVNLQTLAASKRNWQYAFGVESEAGQALVTAFVQSKDHDHTTAVAPELNDQHLHLHTAVGGTFDHLHIGHKLLLTMTLFSVDLAHAKQSSVTVGITGDELLKKKKFIEVLQSWDDRQAAVQDFCDSLLDFSTWPSEKQITNSRDSGTGILSVDSHYQNGLVVKCVQIQDPFGPTITEEAISALVLSAETRSGGKAINDKRSEQGWSSLEVFEVDVLDADEGGVTREGFDAKISSTAIRQRLASKTIPKE